MVLRKVLLTGGSGTLGTELKMLRPNIICPSSDELDITIQENVEFFFTQNRPDLVIHAAAYTDVSKAETDFENVIDVNIGGTLNVLKACIHNKIKMVYISTDYVFDGEKGNYETTDPINPLTKYAKSKAAAELMVRMYNNSLCVRTSFYGREFPYEKAIEDQWTTKDYVDVMAPKILKECLSEKVGVVHCYSEKRTVYQLALERKKDVSRIRIADLNSKIPKDTSLCS